MAGFLREELLGVIEENLRVHNVHLLTEMYVIEAVSLFRSVYPIEHCNLVRRSKSRHI